MHLNLTNNSLNPKKSILIKRNQLNTIITNDNFDLKTQKQLPFKGNYHCWKMTNPLTHDDNNFLYMIYGISSLQKRKYFKKTSSIHQKYLKRFINPEVNEVNINDSPFTNTDKFLRRQKISTSLINEKHRNVFAAVSVILDVPKEKIIAACSKDMKSGWVGFHVPLGLLKTIHRLPADAYKILKKTTSRSHNEVIITGDNKNSIKIKGIILQKFKNGDLIDPELSKEAINFAHKNSLPIIVFNIKETKQCYINNKKKIIKEKIELYKKYKTILKFLRFLPKLSLNITRTIFSSEDCYLSHGYNHIDSKKSNIKMINYASELVDAAINYYKSL